ncbi:MAG: hypothetical protein C4294_16450, partial [Nitrospiraceae bacterium]
PRRHGGAMTNSRQMTKDGQRAGSISLDTPPFFSLRCRAMTATAKKILIVEDEKDILNLVKMYLEKEGYRTCTAVTGLEGLNQVKNEHPDLVILDLMLAELDGLEVCKR